MYPSIDTLRLQCPQNDFCEGPFGKVRDLRHDVLSFMSIFTLQAPLGLYSHSFRHTF